MEDSELEERIDELDEHSEGLVFWEFEKLNSPFPPLYKILVFCPFSDYSKVVL